MLLDVVFVSAKSTVLVPLALAATLYEPVVAFAVNVEEVASPLAFVVATQSYVWGLLAQGGERAARAARRRREGHRAPDTGLPFVSVTSASSGLVNAVLPAADWPEPETSAMLVGVPATTLKLRVLDSWLRCR